MDKFTCPYCYGEHRLKDVDLQCSYNVKGKQDRTCINDVIKVQLDNTGESSKLAWEKKDDALDPKKGPAVWIPDDRKARCMKCTEARKRTFCPTVHKEVPTGCLAGASLPIALIGAKASGKSNYIAVLIDEIRRKMTSSFNCTLDISCSEESKEYYDDYYYQPLYRDNRLVEGTDAGKEIPPLIFPLRFMDSKYRIRKVATLTFYDTAGENLDSDEHVLVLNKYIPNSQGIILLLDPLQIPSVRAHLQGKMPLPPQNTDVAEILNRVILNIRDVKNIKGKIKIPLALAFTKIDALEQFDVIPPGSCLREESAHLKRGAFVMSEFENTNIEMSGILENWLDEELLQMMRQFEKYSLFGLTALGGVPDGNKVRNAKINPKRVLDPLLWILAENKFIDKVK